MDIRKDRLAEAVLTSTHNLRFGAKKKFHIIGESHKKNSTKVQCILVKTFFILFFFISNNMVRNLNILFYTKAIGKHFSFRA